MSKRELINRIRQVNRSVRPEFLEQFSENELNDYLQQLEGLTDRVRFARPARAPALAPR